LCVAEGAACPPRAAMRCAADDAREDRAASPEDEMIERTLERGLFASRWLMAPFYVGLVIGLVVLLVKFAQELLHFVEGVFVATESQVILGVLSLIDLSLTANLVLLVIFSGYENFVSRMDLKDQSERPEWMGKIDFSGLKLKLIASIVAISAIQLLKAFMDIGAASDRDLWWMSVVHAIFVISGILLALSDWISDHAHYVEAKTHGLHKKHRTDETEDVPDHDAPAADEKH
jgi:uncharacterized protein (TIGR00645 family)